MALNKTELGQVIHEITPVLQRGWVQKIHQPGERMVVFDVHLPGRTSRLLVSCQPESSRLHLARLTYPNPPTPPAFCQFLRAHVQGARIDDIREIPDDRIVEISLTGKEGPLALVCELTGKRANLLVLDARRHVLRDLLRQPSLVGQLYRPPTKDSRVTQNFRPSRFPRNEDSEFPISFKIEAHYRDRESMLASDRAKNVRLSALRKSLKKTKKRIEAWDEDMKKAALYRDYRRYGELLKANLEAIKKGAEQVTVVDYYDERLPDTTLPLDPTKSAQGNLNDYFRKYRKYQSSQQELLPRITRAREELGVIEREIGEIERGRWTPSATSPIHPMSAIMTRSLRRHQITPAKQRQGPFRRFISTDGLPIFVGRNAKENEDLTFGLAKSDDLWLHASGTPGSHVVVRMDKGQTPPPETLQDAAMLALLYSDLKRSGRGEVIYTKRKWVKKTKGHARGTVSVTQEKSIRISLDKNRLEALKARSAPTE